MNMSRNLLEKAIIIATKAHAGQEDKGGNPYILHPLAVAARLKSIDEKIVAILHDVVEDTPVTFEELRQEGFEEKHIRGIDSVTRREGETYSEFVDRAKKDPLGNPVKQADMMENKDISRIPNPTEQDFKRSNRYEKELKKFQQ